MHQIEEIVVLSYCEWLKAQLAENLRHDLEMEAIVSEQKEWPRNSNKGGPKNGKTN